MTQRFTHVVSGHHIEPGARIVVDAADHPAVARNRSHVDWLNADLQTVHLADGGSGLHYHTKDGRRIDIKQINAGAVVTVPEGVVWTTPMPNASDEALVGLARVVAAADHRNTHPWLFHVFARQGDVSFASLVQPAADHDERGEADLPRTVGSARLWNATVRLADMPGFQPSPGQIVTGIIVDAVHHHGETVHRLVCGTVLADASTAEDVGRWMPDTMLAREGIGYRFTIFGGPAKLARIEERAYQATLPNEALILARANGGRTDHICLFHQGAVFHDSEDPMEDILSGVGGPGVGLWILHEAIMEGDVEGVQISGRYRPATMDDAIRMAGTRAALMEAVSDACDMGMSARRHGDAEDVLADLIRHARASRNQKTHEPTEDDDGHRHPPMTSDQARS